MLFYSDEKTDVALARIRLTELLFYTLTLATLMGEAFFVLRPALSLIRQLAPTPPALASPAPASPPPSDPSPSPLPER